MRCQSCLSVTICDYLRLSVRCQSCPPPRVTPRQPGAFPSGMWTPSRTSPTHSSLSGSWGPNTWDTGLVKLPPCCEGQFLGLPILIVFVLQFCLLFTLGPHKADSVYKLRYLWNVVCLYHIELFFFNFL